MNRTYSPRASDIERSWFVVDASGQRLGTLASRIAVVLEGKHKPTFATHMDTGDHVIVVNAARVDIGGKKSDQKKYSRHSGYPGGYREETLGHLLERRPEEVIRRAVKGMLPRTKLGVQQLRKLKVYAGTVHPHQAQMPTVLPGTTLTFDPAEMKPAPKPKAAPSPKATPAPEPEVEETPVVAEAAEVETAQPEAKTAEAEAGAEPVAEVEAPADAEAAAAEADTAETTDEPEAEAADDEAEPETGGSDK
jgi:large subunit ribosomal protein L13